MRLQFYYKLRTHDEYRPTSSNSYNSFSIFANVFCACLEKSQNPLYRGNFMHRSQTHYIDIADDGAEL